MEAHSNKAAAAYMASSVENAPPLKIVQLMYGGALRFLSQAQSIDPHADVREYHSALNKADAIVSELRFSLDDSHSKELCQQLESLYLFVESQIREAFLSQDPAHIEPAREVLARLGSAWNSIEAP